MRTMKDSGIEWIGDIPADWKTIKSKYCISISNGTDPKTVGSTPVYGSGAESFKTCGEYKIGPAVLLGRKGATLHIPHYIEGNYWNVDTAFDAIAFCGNINLKFYYYCACVFDYAGYISQTTLPGMTQTNYNNMSIPFPPIEIQKHIANFLDEKCKLIDGIIARQQEVIEKLKAYKLSVITEAVTKGLNPDVPMKDSEVEWIGEIPQSTTVTCARHLYEIVLGKMLSPTPKNEEDSLESYFCAANVHFSDIDYTNLKTMWFSKEERQNYRVNLGDLLIVEGGAGAGGSHIVERSLENCYIQNSIMIARSKSSASNKWLYYTLYSLVKREYVDFVCNKATIPHFTKDKLGNTPVVLFPREIEETIIAFLDEKCSNIDKLIFQKARVIEKLTDYKKSLIYEVVTGKKEV